MGWHGCRVEGKKFFSEIRYLLLDTFVDMFSIRMSADDKSILALGEPHRRLIADAVGFLRGYFTGSEALTDMVCDDPATLLLTTRKGSVLLLGQHKLVVGCPSIALIRILNISTRTSFGTAPRWTAHGSFGTFSSQPLPCAD